MTESLMGQLGTFLTLYKTRLEMTLQSGYPFDSPFEIVHREELAYAVTPVIGEKRPRAEEKEEEENGGLLEELGELVI